MGSPLQSPLAFVVPVLTASPLKCTTKILRPMLLHQLPITMANSDPTLEMLSASSASTTMILPSMAPRLSKVHSSPSAVSNLETSSDPAKSTSKKWVTMAMTVTARTTTSNQLLAAAVAVVDSEPYLPTYLPT